MEPQAATPTGAEASARADVSAITPETSIHDRIKAHIAPAAPVAPAKPEQVARPAAIESEPAANAAGTETAEVDTEAVETETETPEDDALTQAELSTLDELAEATGLELDKLMDLSMKTKIDGKDGSVRLRDLLKSHQLEGHLNQKLMTHADERKAFETERQNFGRERAEKLVRMDAGLKTLERALTAEYAGIDWQTLQASDPAEFNAKYVGYQQRHAQLQDIANQIGAEQQQHQTEMAAKATAYLNEQRSLMAAKIPEWSDATRRAKDRLEIVEYAKGYGLTPQEVDGITDHRQALILRDAWNWHKLQKAKPAVLNKVRTAPRLLKPGTTQSRTEQSNAAAKGERAKLAQTGKVSDATALLKRHLFK